eukprot:1135292-Prymnesium_polylepis.1
MVRVRVGEKLPWALHVEEQRIACNRPDAKQLAGAARCVVGRKLGAHRTDHAAQGVVLAPHDISDGGLALKGAWLAQQRGKDSVSTGNLVCSIVDEERRNTCKALPLEPAACVVGIVVELIEDLAAHSRCAVEQGCDPLSRDGFCHLRALLVGLIVLSTEEPQLQTRHRVDACVELHKRMQAIDTRRLDKGGELTALLLAARAVEHLLGRPLVCLSELQTAPGTGGLLLMEGAHQRPRGRGPLPVPWSGAVDRAPSSAASLTQVGSPEAAPV